jgi:hypothetical protein
LRVSGRRWRQDGNRRTDRFTRYGKPKCRLKDALTKASLSRHRGRWSAEFQFLIKRDSVGIGIANRATRKACEGTRFCAVVRLYPH